jgi:hypothetical protein
MASASIGAHSSTRADMLLNQSKLTYKYLGVLGFWGVP